MKKTLGVLAFQGDVAEHQSMIEKIGCRFVAVRNIKDLEHIDAFIIPGGESTTIERNAYGRQIDSFYTEIDIPKLGISKLEAAFIRAPVIRDVGSKVEVLATHEDEIVLVRQGNLLASTFHPELTGDARLLEWLVGLLH